MEHVPMGTGLPLPGALCGDAMDEEQVGVFVVQVIAMKHTHQKVLLAP